MFGTLVFIYVAVLINSCVECTTEIPAIAIEASHDLEFNDHLQNIQNFIGMTSQEIDGYAPTIIITEDASSLDSIAAAVELAVFEQFMALNLAKEKEETGKLQSAKPKEIYIPVINISQSDLQNKKLVHEVFKSLNLKFEHLLWLDQIRHEPWFAQSNFILIGHQLPEIPEIPRDKVIKVIDNGPVSIMLHGSLREFIDPKANAISSIVCNIIQKGLQGDGRQFYNLLYMAVLLENGNKFNEVSIVHGTQNQDQDLKAIKHLESVTQFKSRDRQEMYEWLVKRRGLSPTDKPLDYYVNKNIRTVWNDARTRCISVVFFYAGSLSEFLAETANVGDAAFNKAINARKCAAIVMFGDRDTDRNIAFIYKIPVEDAASIQNNPEFIWESFDDVFTEELNMTPHKVLSDNRINKERIKGFDVVRYSYKIQQTWRSIRALMQTVMNNEGSHINRTLETFKQELKLQRKSFLVILSNNDIDSIATALALAYYYHQTNRLYNYKDAYEYMEQVLPVLNISRDKLGDRKDLLYFLRVNGIDEKHLICFNEVGDLISNRDINKRFGLIKPSAAKYVVAEFIGQTVEIFDIKDNVIFGSLRGDLKFIHPKYRTTSAIAAEILQTEETKLSVEGYRAMNLLYGATILPNDFNPLAKSKSSLRLPQSSSENTSTSRENTVDNVAIVQLEDILMIANVARTQNRFNADVLYASQQVPDDELLYILQMNHKPLFEGDYSFINTRGEGTTQNIKVGIVHIPISVDLYMLEKKAKAAILAFHETFEMLFLVGSYKLYQDNILRTKKDLLFVNFSKNTGGAASSLQRQLLREDKLSLKLMLNGRRFDGIRMYDIRNLEINVDDTIIAALGKAGTEAADRALTPLSSPVGTEEQHLPKFSLPAVKGNSITSIFGRSEPTPTDELARFGANSRKESLNQSTTERDSLRSQGNASRSSTPVGSTRRRGSFLESSRNRSSSPSTSPSSASDGRSESGTAPAFGRVRTLSVDTSSLSASAGAGRSESGSRPASPFGRPRALSVDTSTRGASSMFGLNRSTDRSSAPFGSSDASLEPSSPGFGYVSRPNSPGLDHLRRVSSPPLSKAPSESAFTLGRSSSPGLLFDSRPSSPSTPILPPPRSPSPFRNNQPPAIFSGSSSSALVHRPESPAQEIPRSSTPVPVEFLSDPTASMPSTVVRVIKTGAEKNYTPLKDRVFGAFLPSEDTTKNRIIKEYLQEAKFLYNHQNDKLDKLEKESLVFVVASNLTDLDSIAATLALAHYRETTKSMDFGQRFSVLQENNYFVIPVLDFYFTPDKFSLKAEVTYVLDKFNLKAADFLYLKDIPENTLNASHFILVNHYIPNPKIDINKVIEVVNDTFPNRIYPSHQNVVTTLVKQGWSASDIVAGRMSQTFTTDSKEFFHILYCALLLQHHPQSIPIIKQSPDFNEPNDHLQTKLQELLMNVHLNTLLLLYRNVEMVWNHTRKVQIAVIELYESALNFSAISGSKSKLAELMSATGCEAVIMVGLANSHDMIIYYGSSGIGVAEQIAGKISGYTKDNCNETFINVALCYSVYQGNRKKLILPITNITA